MEVIATSDLHGGLPLDVPECDLFIVAGDSAPVRGSHAVDVQSLWFVKEFVPWLKRVPAKHKVFIGGNHDFFMDQKESFDRLLKLIDLPDDIHYLRDSSVEVDGLKVHGFPWVPNFPEWAFHARPEDIPRRVASIPEADIIVSHGPAEGILDKVLRDYFPHVGTPGLADRIAETNPALFVCGHIHEGYGLKEVGKTFYANVAQMNRNYEPVNPMVEFTLDKRNGRWEVVELSQVRPSDDLTVDASS